MARKVDTNIFNQLAQLLEDELRKHRDVSKQFDVITYVRGELIRAGNCALELEIEDELIKQELIDEELRQDAKEAEQAENN